MTNLPTPTARLTGTWWHPCVILTFHPWTPHPDGGSLLDRVRELPTRAFNPDLKAWTVEGFGPNPSRWVRAAGFDFTIDDDFNGDATTITDLDTMVEPLVKVSTVNPAVALVRPRFLGFDLTATLVGEGATWDKDRRRFEVPITDLVDADGKKRRGLAIPPDAVTAAVARHRAVLTEATKTGKVAVAAAATDAVTIDGLRTIPSWFGLALYGYQASGAVAAAEGRRLIADEMGLGKTRTALAAAAIDNPDRVIIVAPPVSLTHWHREASASNITMPGRETLTNITPTESTEDVTPAGHVVVINPRRKQPPLPDVGTIIVSDSLLSARAPLAAQLRDWNPDVLIVDEVHRAKTWSSSRAKATRAMAESTTGARYAISGTPMFAQPVELASPLTVTGQLDPVFGGYRKFLLRYSWKNHFGAYVARKATLPELHDKLDGHVWVRRRKDDVLSDLPAKSRHALIVDVDLAGFKEAHTEVIQKINDWVDEMTGPGGSLPTEKEVRAFANDSVHLVSHLRMAAGLAKIDAATTIIEEWLNENPPGEDGLWDRPLVVWTHHKVVTAAMKAAVPGVSGDARVIDGSTSQDERGRIQTAFQAGTVPVLVASITAAGVGITLTRSSDALFVETDWTPANVMQAEDRIHRISQVRPVTITTMIAPGTLDETVQHVQRRKAKVLNAVMGDENNDVSVFDDARPAAKILTDMVNNVLDERRRKQRRNRKKVA